MERPGTSGACARRGRSRGAKPALPQNDELVLLQKYAMQTQVDIVQGALLSAGIFATVRDDGTYYQLLVNREDAATARKVLGTLSEAQP